MCWLWQNTVALPGQQKRSAISQSSLSQQISKLEGELGVNLFVRTTRSVKLTPAGEEFVAHVKRIMSEVSEARRCICDYVSIVKGRLSLGIIPVIGYYNIPNLLATFKSNFPGIKLSLLEEQCEELLRMLLSSEIDAALVQRTISDIHLQYIPLVQDRMVVVVYDRHPFAARKSVELKELGNENLITTPPISGHYYDFKNACHSIGIKPNIIVTCSQVRTILGLVREEVGITVLSSRVAALDMTPGLTAVPLMPAINRKIVLAVPRDVSLSPTLKVFVKFASEWAKANNDVIKNNIFKKTLKKKASDKLA